MTLAALDRTSPVFDPGKLQSMRLARGLTLAALANKINLSAAAVSKWERGRSTPEIENVEKVAEVLECKIEQLFSARPAA